MKIEYHNIYMHYVFVTQNRMPIILEKFRERIEKYITGIVNNNGCKLYKIYANPDHVIILLSCAAFSVSKRNIPALCEYIETQKAHHEKESYEEEHKKLLNFYQKKSGLFFSYIFLPLSLNIS